jgi:hypothetical protein
LLRVRELLWFQRWLREKAGDEGRESWNMKENKGAGIQIFVLIAAVLLLVTLARAGTLF